MARWITWEAPDPEVEAPPGYRVDYSRTRLTADGYRAPLKRSTIDPEVRAAEIVAAINTDYRDGGWFAAMTPGERTGWNMHEDEWSSEQYEYGTTPRNAREWAGWLAREIYTVGTVYGF